MTVRAGLRLILTLASAASVLASGACSGAADDSTADPATAGCEAYTQYQGHAGESVTVYASIRDAEGVLMETSWAKFEECTGIEIEYEADGDFEAQLPTRVDGGNPPDIAFVPQPGVLRRFAAAGKLKRASAATEKAAVANYSPDWVQYGSIDGAFYSAPLGSNVKSFVWYSPKMFKQKGYQIPGTWDELIALSDQIAATGMKPWCAGIESGHASGWPATDWIEDLLLRTAGPAVYDQWVAHSIPFNATQIVEAADKAGLILKNDKYVNGGYGGVRSIATTSFQEATTSLTAGTCALHRQGSFAANQFPDGSRLAPDGDAFVFYFPALDPAKGKPVLGGGEFVAAFADRPEVQAFQTYLASPEHANSRAKLGNWVSANKGLDPANVANPVDKLSVQILQDPHTVFRFDGSDMMPAAVGAGTFWRAMVDWINGKNTRATLDSVEKSWPE